MITKVSQVARKKPAVTISFWFVLAIALFTLSRLIDPVWINVASLPSSESTKAMELIEQEIPNARLEGTLWQGNIVFFADDGIVNHRESIQIYLDELEQNSAESNVVSVLSPVDRNFATQISRDGRTAYAVVQFSDKEDFHSVGDYAIKAAEPLREEITVEFSGLVFDSLVPPSNELFGIVFALIILFFVLRSLISAGLPIFNALLGVAIGTSLVFIVSLVIPMPEVSFLIGAMLGIGVGIDYVLFILMRYKEELKNGSSKETAIDTAMSTAGKAVFAAGATVVISLLGILIVNLDYLNGIAIGAALCVSMMVLVTLTLLPAVLATRVSNYLDKIPFPFYKKEQEVLPTRWLKWSKFIQRHAIISTIAGLIILLLLSAPILSMRIGVTNVGNETEKKTTKRAYDLLAEGFGPGFNGPLVLVVDRRESTSSDDLSQLMRDIEGKPIVEKIVPDPTVVTNVDFVSRFIEGFIIARNDDSGRPKDEVRKEVEPRFRQDVIAFLIYPRTAPQDARTTDFVNELRNSTIEYHNQNSGIKAYVTGVTAGNIDFANIVKERLPLFMFAVLFISFIFLLFTFRSVLVAFKALIMNLLSIAAAYGVVVMVFQFGWFSDILGVGTPGPIEPWAPLILFAILFGLSMDYEVFLISRMKEKYDQTKNNSEAVVHGLAITARVITAAALIMAVVFASFAFSDERPVKLMGIGLAAAVLIDATIVRMILVPATMELLGDKNWWFPRRKLKKQDA